MCTVGGHLPVLGGGHLEQLLKEQVRKYIDE